MDIVTDVIIRKTNHFVAEFLQKRGSSGIVLFLGRLEVGWTVHLDAQTRLGAIKINNEVVNWMLAAKFITEGAVMDGSPKCGFGGRLRMAHFACQLQKGWVDTVTSLHRHCESPLPEGERVG